MFHQLAELSWVGTQHLTVATLKPAPPPNSKGRAEWNALQNAVGPIALFLDYLHLAAAALAAADDADGYIALAICSHDH